MTPAVLVFVVEDEPLIQDLLREALEEAGFEVVTASSGEEAISILEAADANYRALVTDINLARRPITGWDVARRARELRWDLPVVYMTGDSGHQWEVSGVPKSVLVSKPFAPSQIVTAVSNLLNVSGTVAL